MALEKIRPRVIDETGNYTFNNVVTTGSLISGNANIGNIIGITNLVASTTSITLTGSLSTTSNISAGNIKTNNLQYANGNPWAIGSSSTPPGGSNTQVQFNTIGSFDASANFIFNTATNTLVVTNISSNGAQLSSLTASNITGQVANALVSGTVYTNAQPNITSIGILTSLDVTNTITSGNANLGNATTSNYFVGNGSLLSSIAGGNVIGQVGYAAVSNSVSGSNVVGQVTYAATANAVSGANVLGTVGQATYADTANAVSGANVTGTVAQATYATTANSVAGANVSGIVAQATYATTANSVAIANVSGIGNIATINKDGNVSNILYGNGVFAPISVSTGSQILNGTSNVSVASSGNVSIGVAGTASVVTVTSTGVNIAGHLTATANVTGTFIKGNGYYLTGVDQLAAGSADVANSIANGTSNINTPIAGGNITVGIGGTANTAIFTTSGITANTFTGNLFLSVSGTTNAAIVSANMAGSDYFRILVGGTATDGGFVEFATADNGNEPIYFRQYNVSGSVGFGTVARTLTLLDASGDTYIPGKLTTTGNIVANSGGFFVGNGYYLTGVDQLAAGSADVANSIANGTSNINTPIAGGNITVGIGGTSNTIIFTSTGVNVAGYISPSVGSGTNGIIWPTNIGGGTGDVASIKYYAVTGEQTRLEINVQNDYASGAVRDDLYFTTAGYTVVNNSTEATSTTDAPFQVLGGAGVAKKLYVGGNIEAGTNYIKGNGYYLTGVDQLAAGSADIANSIANGTSNINTPIAGGNITVGIGGVGNTVIFTSTGVNVAGTLNVSGNLTVNGTTTSVNSTVTRVVDPIFELGGGANGAALTTDDNKDRGLLLHYYSGANPLDAFMGWDDSAGEFVFSSNVTVSSEVVTFNNYANVKAEYFLGNGYYLTGVDALSAGSADVANSIANGTSNINTPASGGNITVTIGGVANTVVFTSTGMNVIGNITTAGAGGNLSGANYISANFFTGNGSLLTSITGANVSGQVTYAGTANSVAGANVSGTVSSASTAGTVTTAAQPNITSVGTLTSLAVTANVSAGNLKTDNLLYANGVAYSIGSGSAVAGSNTQIQFNDSGSFGGNANLTFNKATAILTANYFAGTLTTNAQPNVTSVGTLSSLTVGNATANTIFGNGTITAAGNVSFTGASVSLGSIGNLSITGGAANYFLKTDGAGSLSWATPSGGVGGTGLTYTPDTAPPATGNVLGDQWFNTTTNVLYEYINDGTGSYWVDTSSPSISSNSSLVGAITIQDEGSNLTNAVSSINFVGSAVTASNIGNAVTVTITADTVSPFLLMGA